jgi:uncharacterized protein
MKNFVLTLAGALLLSTLCSAQNLVPTSDTDDAGSVAGAAQASRSRVQGEQAKQADIRKLLEVTGAGNVATQTMVQMEKSMKPLITNALPPGDYREKLVDLFFDKFHAKMDPTTLADLIVPIYDKYLSDEDVKALIQLYQTPIGQKLITVLPNVAAESQAAGEKWGQEIGRECMLEVLAEHPELQKQMEEAKKNAAEQQ